MIDVVEDDALETFSMIFLADSNKYNYENYPEISDETVKKIVDSIDYKNKNQNEMDDLIEKILNSKDREKLSPYIFEKLNLEQKKKYFLDFYNKNYMYSDVIKSCFEQLPEEDRVEEYNKILERNSDDFFKTQSLVICFEMLPEIDRTQVLKDTFEFVKNRKNNNTVINLLRIIGAVPAEEQEKYYKEVFQYVSASNDFDLFNKYVSAIDKNLHSNIAHDVINCIKEIYIHKHYIDYNAIENLNPFDRNTAFINIINDSSDIINIEFVNILLKQDNIKRDFEDFLVKNNMQINPKIFKNFYERGIDASELAMMYTNVECNKSFNEYLKNHDSRNIISTIEELSSVSYIYEKIYDEIQRLFIDFFSKEDNMFFLNDEELQEFLKKENKISTTDDQKERIDNLEKECVCKIFVITRLNKLKKSYNSLDDIDKEKKVDEILLNLANPVKAISDYGNDNIISITNKLQIDAITEIFNSIDAEKHFNSLYKSIEKMNLNTQDILYLYDKLDDNNKVKFFEDINSQKNLNLLAEILDIYSIKELNRIFKGKTILDEETITKLMSIKNSITIKTLLFNKDVDREKLVDLSSYDQLQSIAINIDSVVKNLYINNRENSRQEFNQVLSNIYNLFTYNNVPEFIKNFRLFQLGNYYDRTNSDIKSFENKSLAERDSIILEDLFKISLDSNNESLREFCNIIIEGKKLTTVLQANPEEKIKTLSKENLAVLYQYRDTLIDLHNITKEIRKNSRPMMEKTDDVIKDLRNVITIYSDNKEHNANSKNLVFNPNKIIDELFNGFITTSIRPKAMLEYMDKIKQRSDSRHLEIEKELKNGRLHLEVGDFVKGIRNFEEYLPSMLRDGIKGGEFNQEYSHSDLTPLDADFGYISEENIDENYITDFQVIQTTVSYGYGSNYIVLKDYAKKLKDRSEEKFDIGTFTGSPDYYGSSAARYIRTGIPITDVDYIVSNDWNYRNGYEMAMANMYIPVIDKEGNLIFTSDDYKKIREEMRGLSHYNAENIEVSEKVKKIDSLYEVYKSVSSKSGEDIDRELEAVRELVDGKLDTVTAQKKKATVEFLKDFFESKGILVTNDLSQNLSTSSVELIDTGSTGRGTNIPGDGDFDFMIRNNLPLEILTELSNKVEELTPKGNFHIVNDGFRAKDVTLPNGEKVDIDITTAKKDLSLSYSSDMCVRDRLNNIKENDPEKYNYVQANIIMAKKILKATGIYKKIGSTGSTEHGGFGGIGVENWILQNGGSFEEAIDTFLETANKPIPYDDFKKKYPIFDFGFNHRKEKIRHDCYSSFFSSDYDTGFNYVKETLTKIQKTLKLSKDKPKEQDQECPLIQSISAEGFSEASTKRPLLRNPFSYDQICRMVAKQMSVPNSGREEEGKNDRQ